MLYVTTLDSAATYTAQTALEQEFAPDGGLFCPMTLPKYGKAELEDLLRRPFWDCAARILNGFFPLRLTGEDLVSEELPVPEFAFIRHKIAVAELWNSKSGSFSGCMEALCGILGVKAVGTGGWPGIAMGIAVLFGLYGSLCRAGWLKPGERVNVAMASGEFRMPMAAWYAGQMGLPLKTAVCVCNENGRPWELLHRGETRLDSKTQKTALPLLDVGLPQNLERLVSHRLGPQTALQFAEARERGGLFSLNQVQQETLREGFAVSVVGAARGKGLIPSIYQNSDYLLSPYTALVYSGLMDYRALGGEGTPVLLLAEESPLRWGADVLGALKLPVENLVSQIGQLESRAAARRKGD